MSDEIEVIDEKRFTLRVPTELYQRLNAKAKSEKRTLTAQILFMLERTLNSEESEMRYLDEAIKRSKARAESQ